jgi:hypothetical protein
MRIQFPSSLILLSATVMLSLVLAACGSGGDGGGGSTNNTVTLTYPSGRVMAVGEYLPGTTTRTGEWKEYYDLNGSPQEWRRNYVNGSWDQIKDWREWNADGSIRNDASDL